MRNCCRTSGWSCFANFASDRSSLFIVLHMLENIVIRAQLEIEISEREDAMITTGWPLSRLPSHHIADGDFLDTRQEISGEAGTTMVNETFTYLNHMAVKDVFGSLCIMLSAALLFWKVSLCSLLCLEWNPRVLGAIFGLTAPIPEVNMKVLLSNFFCQY